MGTVHTEQPYQPLPLAPDPQHAHEQQLLPHAPDAPDAPAAAATSHHCARASWAYIYVLCIANFGISAAWALEFATVTPFFEAVLRAGPFISHTVWMVGPLSGLLVAPIVGALSDRCTSPLGRRRPFIIVGIIATVLSMLCFSNAPQLARWLLRHGHHARAHARVSLALAIGSFCVLDVAINTTMWPVRALQADLLPQREQHRVQSAAVVLGSLGDLGVNALLHSYHKPVSHMRSCYLLAALLYLCTLSVLLVVGTETRLQPQPQPQPRAHDAWWRASSSSSRSLRIVAYLRSLPMWMWRIGATYALGFFMLFCVMPNLSSWLGASVLRGDPNAPDGSAAEATYERGVSMYGNASLIRALVQIVFSALYPMALRWVSAGKLMGACFGLFGVLLAALSATKSALLAQLVVVMLAFPEAAHFTLPTALTVEYSDHSNRGKYLGALNCFAVIPQLIDTTYTGWVSDRFGEAAVMMIGAVWGILTGVSGCVFMNVQQQQQQQQQQQHEYKFTAVAPSARTTTDQTAERCSGWACNESSTQPNSGAH